MITAPDESYSAAEAAELLRKSERQILRYLANGRLGGSRASGRWLTTALQIWRFQGISDDMLENWRLFCRQESASSETTQNQQVAGAGE